MAMRAGDDSRDGVIAEINVTPMADVMIVLLIIFMVTIPLIPAGVPVDLPEAANAKDRSEDPRIAVIAVRRDGVTFFGRTRLATAADLLPRLQERLEGLPAGRRTVHVRADEGLSYAAVESVLDLCREAGAEEVALIVERKPKG